MESQERARPGWERGLAVRDPFPISGDSQTDVPRANTKAGGDGKSKMVSLSTVWWDRDRVGAAVASGRGGDVASPSRSRPERRDEEGEMRISGSATVTLQESLPTSLNSSHTSEEFLKRAKRPSNARSPGMVRLSTKVGVRASMGVVEEFVLPIDDVGLSGGVMS